MSVMNKILSLEIFKDVINPEAASKADVSRSL